MSTNTYSRRKQTKIGNKLAAKRELQTPAIVKLANIEDKLTGDSYEVFGFRKTLGRRGTLKIERDKARDKNALLSALLRKNAILPADQNAAHALIDKAIQSDPQRHRLHVKHLGWLPGGKGFALKRGVIGSAGRRLELRPPIWVNARQVGDLQIKGTLEDWQRHVVGPSRYSDLLIFLLASAFAGPLLRFSGLQNFGTNIVGPSKIGKTTGLLVAASVIGIGTERQLPNWNATSSAFMETALGFNDLFSPVNEVGLLAGKKSDAYGPIRERIYIFSEGRDKARLSSSSAAAAWTASMFRGIFISTSEHSFNAYAAYSGETRSDGEYARCMDVPAKRRGHTTIFNRYPKTVEPADRQAWARALLAKLRHNCARFHGSALVPFIKWLIEHDQEVRRRYPIYIKEFMRNVDELNLDGALEHAGRNFAHVYASGCIARRAGVLPLSDRIILRAVLSCFKAAVADIHGYTNTLGRGREALKAKLLSGKIGPGKRDVEMDPKRIPGYYNRTDEDRLQFTIYAKAFRGWFSNRAQAIAVLLWLDDEGLLIRGNKRGAPSLKSTGWAEHSPRWPGGKVVKSIQFWAPFGLDSSSKFR